MWYLFGKILSCGQLCLWCFVFRVSLKCFQSCFHSQQMKTSIQSKYHVLSLDVFKCSPSLDKIFPFIVQQLQLLRDSIKLVLTITVLPPCGKEALFPFLAFISTFALTFCGKVQIDCLKSQFTERVIWLHLLRPIKQLWVHSTT